MAKVIAIVNQKGGVAKSTSCVNLGIGLVKKGYKVLAIDFDPQGSLTEQMRLLQQHFNCLRIIINGSIQSEALVFEQ